MSRLPGSFVRDNFSLSFRTFSNERGTTARILSYFEVENAFLLPKFRIVKTVLQIFGKRIEKYIKKKVQNIKSMIYMVIQKQILSYIKVTHFYLFSIFMICVNHSFCLNLPLHAINIGNWRAKIFLSAGLIYTIFFYVEFID